MRVGYTVGGYELVLKAAQGGMAMVWAARMRGSRGFSKIVAIKTMLPELSRDPHFEAMFLREAELASRIKHPNVCEILDLGEEDKVLYLVMEWIDGDSLSTLLSACERQERRMPFSITARICLGAAKGLHAAHELKDEKGSPIGLVHRDVSPQNILISSAGIVKIVDFGLAKAIARSDHQETNVGHLKGKIQFMAPEQAFCDAIDRRVDVFALGIVLYQLVTRVHPFRADNELATLARITAPSPVERPETLSPDCPPSLGDVIMKALAKDKNDRFSSMGELARALEAILPELDAPDGAPSLDGFIAEILGGRVAERTAALQAALEAAESRSLAPPAAHPSEATPRPFISTTSAVMRDVDGPAIPEPVPSPPRRRRAVPVAIAVGLLASAGAGAALLGSGDPAPQGGPASPVDSEPTATTTATATATATATTTATATATATANANVTATVSAVPSAAARPKHRAGKTAPTGPAPTTNFRKPDF